MFFGNEVGIEIKFPPKIGLIQFIHYEDVFFEELHDFYRNRLAILRFSDSPRDLEAKSWDRELTAQTVSLTVTPWELKGLRS